MASDSDSEVYADNLSQIGSDLDIPDFDSECESDEDFFNPRRRRVLPIMSSDSEGSDSEEVEWSEFDNHPNIEPFLGQSGVVLKPNNPQSVSEVVQLFLGNDLFDYMAEESNRYHSQNIDRFKDSAKSLKWKDVSAVELKKMLGLLLLMGRVRKENRDEYWSTDRTIETPIFAQVMSRDRFRQIWYAWHFSNNENNANERDRLNKIRPIVSYFKTKFEQVYKPERDLSLDESIMPWRGRLLFKVYNASKINKYGILIRMVCEAKTGYICNYEIYHGEGSRLQDTIIRLLQPYKNLWHHVYMNNYYNSVDTCQVLLQHGIRSCGTIRKNRELPPYLQDITLRRDESVFRRRGDILVQCWQSKRLVRMISTIHSASVIQSRNVDWNTKQNIWKPTCVVEYNKFMKGVDRADQYLSYYSIIRRTKKWTKRTVMFLINGALFNAFRVFQTLNANSKIKYKTFLHDVAKVWINENVKDNIDDPGPSTSYRRNIFPKRLLDASKHNIVKITGGKKIHPQRQCHVCATHKKKSLTCFMCQLCSVPLHKGECFHKFHTCNKY
ncbi:piggyBac transposable element-derived protein 4-like [Ctenocephalides felis]|uniref:piggyBac transposable element-derived protein 4-like n=1 Tax=Ctenocephalides felis TaxID=7515 RepID=UPI000E6E30FD|nr:piggyBac transposable element-derived protein 4-like [Ctenocephalides felis]